MSDTIRRQPVAAGGIHRRPPRRFGPDDRTLLIVEDDLRFAGILLDMAREKGFKALVSLAGREAGLGPPLTIARRHHCSTSSCPTWKAGRSSIA